MSSKSNKTVIGAFVVGAVALLVAGVLVLGSGRFLADVLKVAFYFDGTVKGLNEGAPVMLKGVKIGSVTDITLQYDIERKTFQTEVYAEVTKKVAPVGDEEAIRQMLARRDLDIDQFREEMIMALHEEGLRAQLGVQSIVTGMLQVELDLHQGAEPAKLYKNPDGYWVITTMPSDMEKLKGSIQDAPIGEIMADLRDSLEGIDRLVNSVEVGDSIKHLDSSLRGIDELVAKINEDYGTIDKQLTELTDAAKTLLNNLDEKYPPLADSIEEALQDTRKLVNNMDEQVKPLAENVEATLEDTRKLVNNMDGQIEPLMAGYNKTLSAADEVLLQAKKSLELLEGLAPPDSAIAYKLANTLDTLTEAMDNLKSLLAYLQQHPEAILRGKSN